MKLKFHKKVNGDFYARTKGLLLWIFKRPHGGWALWILRNHGLIYTNGYHGTALPLFSDAKKEAEVKANELLSEREKQ